MKSINEILEESVDFFKAVIAVGLVSEKAAVGWMRRS